jgi:rubrerythrin
MTNIYDFALEFEKDSETLYRDLINNIINEGIKKIITMLAEEEAKHYEIILKMKDNIKDLFYENTDILDNSQNIIKKIKDNENNENFVIDNSQLKILENARTLEDKSKKFYEEKSNEVKSDKQKNIFLKLAKEEEKHFFIIDNLLIHLSRPQTWVEDAEFTTREEY